MAVAALLLRVHEKPLRHDQVQVVFRARHRHVKKPPLLFDLGAGAGGEVGRKAAIDGVEDKDRLPFLPLGRMNGRENEVILLKQRIAGAGARCLRRIEGKLGQKTLAVRIGRGNLREL